MTPATSIQCSSCGEPLACGAATREPCWCEQLPALPAAAIDSTRGCLCPACLARAVARISQAVR